jgi:hypothetical protein
MDLGTDSRGQSVQVGAVILFGIAIVLLSTYQATIVPDQNSQAEFQHSQKVHSQLVEIRNTITTPPPRDESQGVELDLGTRYEGRTVGINQRDPAGTIRTVGTDDSSIDVEIQNARTVRGTPGYWDDTTSFNTGALVYEPDYNQYPARRVVYDNQALYTGDADSGTGTLADSSLIHGRELNLVMLTGSLHMTGSTPETFDIKTVDRSQETLHLKNKNSDPLTIQFHSRQPESYWKDQLLPSGSEDGHKGEYIKSNGISGDGDSNDDGWYEITIELEEDETYDLTLTKVGIGDDVEDRTEDGTKISMAKIDSMNHSQFEDWSRHPIAVKDSDSDYPDDPAFIGGVGEFGEDAETEKTFRLPNGKYEVGATYYSVMTWDGDSPNWGDDSGQAYWNGDIKHDEPYQQNSGPFRHEISFDVEVTESDDNTATLRFTSTLDENANNEAFGIDNVWIRHADND